MRGLLLIIAVGAAMSFVVAYPFVGFLTWEWLNLMNPHRLTFGSTMGFNFTQWVAIATIAAWAISKERKISEISGFLILISSFLVWISISQLFSLDPSASQEYSSRFTRVVVFALLGLLVVDSKLRIQAVIWIMVLSIGYFGVKGGAFTLLSGGALRVQGPAGSIIANNNHLGLAIATSLPLIVYLYQTTQNKLVQIVLGASGVLSLFAVLGTQSRGAFVAIAAISALLWWRSKRKVSSLVVMAAVIVPVVLFMPQSWSDRMFTIQEYETDNSFQGRVDAWTVNLKVALDHPLTGAGLRVPYSQEFTNQYTDGTVESRAAHSIYFEVLGGMGLVGFFIFVALLAHSQLTLFRLRKKISSTGSNRSGYYLVTALQVSLTGFMVGGLVQSMEMWEGYWLLIIMSANLERLHRETSVAIEPEPPILAR